MFQKIINIYNTRKFISWVLGLCLTLIILCFSVIITFNTKSIYPTYCKFSNLESFEDINETTVFSNYNYIIDFITEKDSEKFQMPDFKSSVEGTIHFEEVRKVYWFILSIFVGCLAIFFIFLFIQYFLKINNDYFFVKISYKLLIFFTILFTIPSMVLFGKSFDWIHMLIFRNDYWLLDSSKDPIINFLPENYFLVCFIIIFGIIVLSILLLKILYYHLKKGVDSYE